MAFPLFGMSVSRSLPARSLAFWERMVPANRRRSRSLRECSGQTMAGYSLKARIFEKTWSLVLLEMSLPGRDSACAAAEGGMGFPGASAGWSPFVRRHFSLVLHRSFVVGEPIRPGFAGARHFRWWLLRLFPKLAPVYSPAIQSPGTDNYYIAFAPGINPRPTLKQSFSAACSAVPFVQRVLPQPVYPLRAFHESMRS